MDLCNKGDVITPFDGKDPIFWVMDHRIQIHMYKAVLRVWIRKMFAESGSIILVPDGEKKGRNCTNLIYFTVLRMVSVLYFDLQSEFLTNWQKRYDNFSKR
jgi:hypothetical protein